MLCQLRDVHDMKDAVKNCRVRSNGKHYRDRSTQTRLDDSVPDFQDAEQLSGLLKAALKSVSLFLFRRI